jgi:hypothetical protein
MGAIAIFVVAIYLIASGTAVWCGIIILVSMLVAGLEEG